MAKDWWEVMKKEPMGEAVPRRLTMTEILSEEAIERLLNEFGSQPYIVTYGVCKSHEALRQLVVEGIEAVAGDGHRLKWDDCCELCVWLKAAHLGLDMEEVPTWGDAKEADDE